MAKRDQDVHFLASKEEVERIHEKMDELGIRSMGAYLRKMALDGYCIRLDLQDVKALVSLLRICSNNLNQYAKRANETGSIYRAGIEDIGTAGAVRCKSDLHSWKSAYKCCVLCNWFIALGHWRICDLLHCKGFVAVPAYSCGSWNCDNSSGVLARLGCYESREYWRKSGSIYQVIR